MHRHTPGDPDNLIRLSEHEHRRLPERPVPISQKIAERKEVALLERLAPTDEELRDAADRADGGNRLAFPMLFDGLGSDPVADRPDSIEIDALTANIVGVQLGKARDSILDAGRALPLQGHGDLHRRFNDLVNEISAIGSVLAERRAGGDSQ